MAPEHSGLEPRKLGIRFTGATCDFVLESTIYRLLEANNPITSSASTLIIAAEMFLTKTFRPDEM
ncbi:hypothetical protein [Erythrobacter ani]|uniref:hypothetical protein n=1 Tax=Erythrobacter ani TaxID=2827235 RepID=UPI003F716C0C